MHGDLSVLRGNQNNSQSFFRRVQRIMADKLNVPTSEYALDDIAHLTYKAERKPERHLILKWLAKLDER